MSADTVCPVIGLQIAISKDAPALLPVIRPCASLTMRAIHVDNVLDSCTERGNPSDRHRPTSPFSIKEEAMQNAMKGARPASRPLRFRAALTRQGVTCLLIGLFGIVPSRPLYASNNSTAAGQCPALVEAAKHKAPTPAAPTLHASPGDSCLVNAAALDATGVDIIDIRDRTQFLQFHVPGAQQASADTIATLPAVRSRKTVIYSDGKFRSDAAQLCERLRQSGLAQAHVVDGGMAAWAQLHGREEALATNRLSDAEIAAALAEPGNASIVIADSLKPVAATLPGNARSSKARRNIVLADAATQASTILTQLGKGSTTSLYWIGSAEQLRRLLDVQLAQDRKRLAGHGESATCSSL